MDLIFWFVFGGILGLGLIVGSFLNCAIFRFLISTCLSKNMFLLKYMNYGGYKRADHSF